MLVVVDGDGVPSVVRMLTLEGNSAERHSHAADEGATSTAPATIALAANASDPDGSVAKVEFFNGATKLGDYSAAPYTLAWTGVPAGGHALTARATDVLAPRP